MFTLKDWVLAQALSGGDSGGSGGGGGTGGGNIEEWLSGATTDVVSTVTSIKNDVFSERSDVTSVSFPHLERVPNRAFTECTALNIANIPSATSIGDTGFYVCPLSYLYAPNITSIGSYGLSKTALTDAQFQKVTSLSAHAFNSCLQLKVVDLPELTGGSMSLFYGCTNLERANIGKIKDIGTYVFRNCESLSDVILQRTDAITSLSVVTAFEGTPIASGTGYIYVPSALVDTYKAATNWSTYAAQFRALEDYTVDGTITGELDPSKI